MKDKEAHLQLVVSKNEKNCHKNSRVHKFHLRSVNRPLCRLFFSTFPVIFVIFFCFLFGLDPNWQRNLFWILHCFRKIIASGAITTSFYHQYYNFTASSPHYIRLSWSMCGHVSRLLSPPHFRLVSRNYVNFKLTTWVLYVELELINVSSSWLYSEMERV